MWKPHHSRPNFFSAEELPEKYQQNNERYDTTVIHLDKETAKKLSFIIEERRSNPQKKTIPVKAGDKVIDEWAFSAIGYIPGEPITLPLPIHSSVLLKKLRSFLIV